MARGVKYLFIRYQERKALIYAVRQRKDQLFPGRYYMAGGGKRIVYQKRDECLRFIACNDQQLLRSQTERHNILRFLLSRWSRFRVNALPGDFQGVLVMFTKVRDTKIFDFHNHKIRTFCHDPERYAAIKLSYERFDWHFPLTIQGFDDRKMMIEEKYVCFKPYILWSEVECENTLRRICEMYASYFRDNKALGEKSAAQLCRQANNIMQLVGLANLIAMHFEGQNLSFPSWFLHGDMGFHNILKDQERFYIIDLEDAGEHVFYYDFMNILFFEAAIQGNDTYLKRYWTGEYDEYFEALFSSAGVGFNPAKRDQYFMVYVLERCLSEIIMNPRHVAKLQEICLNYIERYVMQT